MESSRDDRSRVKLSRTAPSVECPGKQLPCERVNCGCKIRRWTRQYQPILRAAVLTLAAATLYSYHLGYKALGPSEAYSALAAAQPTVRAVAHNAMQFDPGKPVLYHLLLHWFCGWFGTSETALRAFSLIFGLASVALVFAYCRELFGPQVAVAAAAMWAFNPLALILARWARMYSMFVAFSLAHLLAMAKLRHRATITRTIVAGGLGAAMLYSHLAAVFLIAADLIVVVREFRCDRRSVSWPAVAIAVFLFAPFMPAAAAQTARNSVFAGDAVAHRLGSPTLLRSVHEAFVHGMDVALLVSVGIAVLGILITLIFLPAKAGTIAAMDAARTGSGNESVA